MIVHCTIFGNPEPDIKWFKDKIPLNLCSIPRYKIFNHPDELHEHTIASLIVTSPSYLDNGDFIIELRNEIGFERRVLNVQFQTEDEYNAIYFQKYLEHKENLKYHQYRPGEQRWEDIVPEVKEFVFWEPPEEENAAIKKKKRKKKRKVLKTIITPWGDEKQVEVTDEEDSGESIECSEADEDEPQEEVEEEEEEQGWNVEGEVAESDPEEENAPTTFEEPKLPESEVQQLITLEQDSVLKEDVNETPREEQPKIIEMQESVEDESLTTDREEVSEPEALHGIDESQDQIENQIEDNAYGEEQTETVEEEYEPYVRKEPEVEHPIILRRPKFYITDFQLRKKFYFVSKLINVELMKGKTLRMQSISSSVGPVTCEWRHNGRLVKAPTARKYIEFYPRKNMTVLEIENTRVQDSGTYTCTHYNDYTEPLIDSCKVVITVPQPKETADQPPTFTRLLTGINHYRLIKLTGNRHNYL